MTAVCLESSPHTVLTISRSPRLRSQVMTWQSSWRGGRIENVNNMFWTRAFLGVSIWGVGSCVAYDDGVGGAIVFDVNSCQHEIHAPLFGNF